MNTETRPRCGLHVPSPDEIDALGVTREKEHPNFIQRTEPEIKVLGLTVGGKLSLPVGTPRSYPPYLGATMNWSARARRQVNRIRRKAPGVVCATYPGHGRTGEPWGVDVMVSPFNVLANPAQERFGDALCNWIVSNWVELHVNYVIWWNWMNDGAGWFDYEPYRKGGSGSQLEIPSKHLDHLHVQIDNPFVAGNE